MGKMEDGWDAKISFSGQGSQIDVYMFETEVTPPGLAAGGPIDTTTLRNLIYRTQVPKSLISGTPASFVGAYDPDLLTELLTAIGVNQEIVITYPDDSTLTFWGWIDEFTPGPLVEGVMPLATITIIPSNWDGSAEIAPAMGP